MSVYDDEFKEESRRSFLTYKQELLNVLEGDFQSVVEAGDYSGPDDEEPNFFDYVQNDILGVEEPVSGFMLDKKFGVVEFSDDVAYVVFNKAMNGPDVNYVVGSNGEAFITFNQAGFKVEKISGDFEYSPLHQYAGEVYGDVFTKNKLVIDEDELSLRTIAALRVDSFEEWMKDESSFYNTEVVTYKDFVECLNAVDFDSQKATEKILVDGWYNYADIEGRAFGREDFIKDIETHIDTIKELMEHDDFYSAASAFSVNTSKLDEVDFDDLEELLNNEFPEQKVKNKMKPKM